MREVTENVFTYNELDEQGKEKALQWFREHVSSFDLVECVSDLFKHELEHVYKLPTESVEWSLGYSQGDGVAFYGNVDMKSIVEILKKEDYPAYHLAQKILKNMIGNQLDLGVTIIRNSFGYHYSHWNTMEVVFDQGDSLDTVVEELYNVEFYDLEDESLTEEEREEGENFERHYERVNKLAVLVKEVLTRYIQEVSRTLEKLGYDEIEYMESEEQAKQFFDDNEIGFYDTGKVYS